LGRSARVTFSACLTFTPLVFVFLTLAGDAKYLLVPRIVDTAIGAAIVLVLDVMLWSTAPSLRPAPQLAAAQQALDHYQRDAPSDDPIRRNILRRNALRAVARARSSFNQSTTRATDFFADTIRRRSTNSTPWKRPLTHAPLPSFDSDCPSSSQSLPLVGSPLGWARDPRT
jgi:uncharacterized membrane protein YccC